MEMQVMTITINGKPDSAGRCACTVRKVDGTTEECTAEPVALACAFARHGYIVDVVNAEPARSRPAGGRVR